MTCAHHSLHVHARGKTRPRLADPTQTLTLRRHYEIAAVNRFRALEGDIHRYMMREPEGALLGHALAIDPATEFVSWLNRRVDARILEVTERDGADIVAASEWQRPYVDAAYERGVADGGKKMKRAGAAVGAEAKDGRSVGFLFDMNRQKKAVDLLLARNFEELKGVTSAMSQGITRTLLDGLAKGANPLVTAREMVKKVENIGVVRARMIARTETIRAYAEANLDTFAEFGADGVTALAEILTAGDGKVCEECMGWEVQSAAQPITIDEARGLIPFHPNCRCAWIPYVEGATAKRVIAA